MYFELICDDYVQDEEYIWFVSKEENALYKLNIITKETVFVAQFPECDDLIIRAFYSLIKVGDRIFFIPCEAAQIYIFDIKNNSVSNIKIEVKQIERFYWHNPSKTLFWKAELVGNMIYVAGMGYPGILKIDIETLEIKILDEWVDLVESCIDDNNDEVYIQDLIVDGDYILFPLCCMDGVLQLKISDDSFSLNTLKSGISGYSGIIRWKEDFILLPRKHENIVVWNKKENKIEKIVIPYQKLATFRNRLPFARYFLYGDKLYLCRSFCNVNYIVDLENMQVHENSQDGILQDKLTVVKYISDNTILYIDNESRDWNIYDLKNGKLVEKFKLYKCGMGKKIVLASLFEGKESITETDSLKLEDILLYLSL